MYTPLSTLFKAVGSFASEVKEDITQAVTKNPTVVVTYPNGIESITLEEVELTAVLYKGDWTTTIVENGNVLKPTDEVYDHIRDYVSLDLSTL